MEEKKQKIIKMLGIVSFFVIMAAALYICFAYYYMRTIFPRTFINNVDCGELSVEHAEKLIEEKVEDYELILNFRDGNSDSIYGEAIAYEYISQGQVQEILDNQNVWGWILEVFIDKNYEIEEAIQFDETLLKEEYHDLDGLSSQKQIMPKDAYVTYENGEFVIVPEDYGNLIKQKTLYKEVLSAVTESKTELNLEELNVYAEPEILYDSAKILMQKNELNTYANVSITYELPNDKTEVLDGNVIREWLNTEEDGHYSISDSEMKDKVADYVANLAKEYNTVGNTRRFETTKRGMIEIAGGSYGFKIDQKKEVAQILEELKDHVVTTRTPIYASTDLTSENNGLGHTYIEIDLTSQHLWYYIDGKLYMESDLVSGTYYNKGRRTPGGIYLMTYKAQNAVLRGQRLPDGSYSYESPVKFWMPFNGGIGLHDASWRGRFGGSIYLYNGSHGCINLPYNSAKAIYAEIDKSTPIICYY